ncbi:hypothetical protein KI694_07310 [Enterobacter oligotrophicus]|uniref:hypothetical protein n=1 Tax=Enterobacter TaxID=547 RepID=UPI001C0342A8|nr:hypothetical protein [Enterobacter oligotrophicus]ELW1648489.1 hypothetical protein [Enterobacter oligotrophicus]MBT9425348.1 hypothetical protein [Enterobacter oligotrophicus]
MRQNTAAWQHDAVWAVQQDNGAQALMEVGTRNTRFTSVRHGKVTDRTVRNAGETQKWRSVCQSRLNEINVLLLAYDCVDFLI